MTHHHSEMMKDFQRTPGRREDQPEGDPFEADAKKSAAANKKIDEAPPFDGSGQDAATGARKIKNERGETIGEEPGPGCTTEEEVVGRTYADPAAELERRAAAKKAKK